MTSRDRPKTSFKLPTKGAPRHASLVFMRRSLNVINTCTNNPLSEHRGDKASESGAGAQLQQYFVLQLPSKAQVDQQIAQEERPAPYLQPNQRYCGFGTVLWDRDNREYRYKSKKKIFYGLIV